MHTCSCVFFNRKDDFLVVDAACGVGNDCRSVHAVYMINRCEQLPADYIQAGGMVCCLHSAARIMVIVLEYLEIGSRRTEFLYYSISVYGMLQLRDIEISRMGTWDSDVHRCRPGC